MFAVCGEALFDVYATGDTKTGLMLDARMGGSPFNVAVGLCRLGQEATLVTRVSNGFLGQRLMRALAEEGVHTRAVQRGDEPTTLSLIGLDEHGVPSYSFHGQGCADRLLDESALDNWPAQVRCIHVGSYATVMGKTAQTQRALIERERSRALISYDPNIRLNVQPDVAVWRQQVDWMLSRAHLIKASEEDLDLLGLPDSNGSLESFAHRALESGVKLVVVTRGESGACAWTRHEQVQVDPVRVKVVDTVGAGDTFQAALLTALNEQGCLTPDALVNLSAPSLHRVLEFAARAAALTCSRRGADLPLRAELHSAKP